MSDDKSGIPADLLLMLERKRKLGQLTGAVDSGRQTVDMNRPVADQIDELLIETDAIVETAAPRIPTPSSGATELYRPLAYVSLGGLAWSGAVDHDALQAAIVCAPVRGTTAPKPPQWLSAVTTLALSDIPRAEPSLFVQLAADDIAVLGRIGLRVSPEAAVRLLRAAALPSMIVEADPITAGAAGAVLRAYRHAALVYAWQAALVGNVPADAARERDASAVQLMSILRALLGEI